MSIFTSVLKLPAESFCSSLTVLNSILLIFFTFLNIANKQGLSPFDEDFLTFLSFKILTSFFFQKQKPVWLCSFRINRKKNPFFSLDIPHMFVHGTGKHVYAMLPLEYWYLFFTVLSRIYASTSDFNLKRSGC